MWIKFLPKHWTGACFQWLSHLHCHQTVHRGFLHQILLIFIAFLQIVLFQQNPINICPLEGLWFEFVSWLLGLPSGTEVHLPNSRGDEQHKSAVQLQCCMHLLVLLVNGSFLFLPVQALCATIVDFLPAVCLPAAAAFSSSSVDFVKSTILSSVTLIFFLFSVSPCQFLTIFIDLVVNFSMSLPPSFSGTFCTEAVVKQLELHRTDMQMKNHNWFV